MCSCAPNATRRRCAARSATPAPLYRDAPEAHAARAAGNDTIARFMREALPAASPAQRKLAAELITTTLGAAGKEFSETPRTALQVKRYSEAMADMFCAYLSTFDRAVTGRLSREGATEVSGIGLTASPAGCFIPGRCLTP